MASSMWEWYTKKYGFLYFKQSFLKIVHKILSAHSGVGRLSLHVL